MDKQIKITSTRLQRELLFIMFLSVVASFVCIAKSGSYLTIDGELKTNLRTVALLYTIGMIPFSLRLFAKQVLKVENAVIDVAMSLYSKWFRIRLTLILSVVIINALLCFFTSDNSDMRMLPIGLIALFFCGTSSNQIISELRLNQEEDENNSEQ